MPARYGGLNLGSQLALFTFAFDSAGDTLGIRPAAGWWHGGASGAAFPVEWWSSDSSIASVDSLGVVVARRLGTTYIHARTVAAPGDTLADSVAFPTTAVRPASRSPLRP